MVEHALQLVGLEEPDAAGGEQALEEPPAERAGAQDAHDGEASTPFEDATGLAQGTGRVSELVQGAAAEGPGEAGVGERGMMGVRPDEGGSGPDLSGAAGGFFQHGGGDVHADHFALVAERVGQAARVEAGRAPEVDEPATALEVHDLRDDLQLSPLREGFTG